MPARIASPIAMEMEAISSSHWRKASRIWQLAAQDFHHIGPWVMGYGAKNALPAISPRRASLPFMTIAGHSYAGFHEFKRLQQFPFEWL